MSGELRAGGMGYARAGGVCVGRVWRCGGVAVWRCGWGRRSVQSRRVGCGTVVSRGSCVRRGGGEGVRAVEALLSCAPRASVRVGWSMDVRP